MRKDRSFSFSVGSMYKAILAIGIFIIIIFSCEKKEVEPPRDFPRVLTGSVTDITEEGAEVHGEIVLQGSEPVIDRGFVWYFNDRIPKVENADFITLPPDPDNPAFSYKIRSTLYKDMTYKVRAFARTGSHTVYGNLVTFKSKGSRGPEMTGFSPKSGTRGDTVRIYGRFFGNKRIRITDRGTSNIVKFDDKVVNPVSWSDSVIVATVPANLSKTMIKITVTVAGKSTTVDEYFLRIGAEITDFNPKTGVLGDTVIITGKRFQPVGLENKVFFSSVKALVVESDTSYLKVVVPPKLREVTSTITVISDNLTLVADSVFTLMPPIIKNLIPNTALVGDTILIEGENFTYFKEENHVSLRGRVCEVVEASRTSLSVVLPRCNCGYGLTYPFPVFNIYVEIAGLQSNGGGFTYIAPMVDSFTPDRSFFNDTLFLYGKNFSSFEEELQIFVSPHALCDILYVKNNEVAFLINENATKPDIEVITRHYSGYFKNAFVFHSPVIQSVVPDTARVGDTITIAGRYFHPILEKNEVTFNGIIGNIINSTENEIKAIVPVGVNNGYVDIGIRIRVYYGNYNGFFYKEDALVLVKP